MPTTTSPGGQVVITMSSPVTGVPHRLKLVEPGTLHVGRTLVIMAPAGSTPAALKPAEHEDLEYGTSNGKGIVEISVSNPADLQTNPI